MKELPSKSFESLVDRVRAVLAEDDYTHDLASAQLGEFLGADPQIEFEVIAKEPLIFCGQQWVRSFAELKLFEVSRLLTDGTQVSPGTQVLVGSASLCQTLSFERTLLNGMQRWSGVATLTKLCVNAVARAHGLWSSAEQAAWPMPKLLHTRKTTPLWRDLEIEGVLAGGGHAHRRSLSERPMIKENHKEPVLRARGEWMTYLEGVIGKYPNAVIEVETWAEAREALSLGAACLLLDNFSSSDLRLRLVEFLLESRAKGQRLPLIEVSGGITPSNLEDYVIPGVNRISMGALTHAYRSVDLSLNVLSKEIDQ